MELPYERQILRLLQEHSHYRVVVRHCRQENAKYTDELEKTCREIERAVYEMEEKQQAALSQWRNTRRTGKNTNYFSCCKTEWKKWSSSQNRKDAKLLGQYLEFTIMEEILGLLDQVGNLYAVITGYRRYRPGQIPGYQTPDSRSHYRACSVFLW